MSEFRVFYDLGNAHILDLKGYDHILFVVALSALYLASDWKKILILITAFTIGHSITLALATLKIININQDLIEFLIPITIGITALYNLFQRDGGSDNRISINYFFAIFFGLIHGLGFSNYLKSILGEDSSIFTQLFAFNVGLEVGQIIIVVTFLILSFLVVDLFGIARRDWKIFISALILGISIPLTLSAIYW